MAGPEVKPFSMSAIKSKFIWMGGLSGTTYFMASRRRSISAEERARYLAAGEFSLVPL